MCIFATLTKNPKYLPNKKNGGKPPFPLDNRVTRVAIGCGECIECRKQKANGWKTRLLEDIKTNTNGKFITLTFSNQSIKELANEIPKQIEGYDLDNAIATLAVRRFTERHRKKYKKTIRHWLTTELGHNGTENIHLHGIIWTNENLLTIEKIWKYGFMWKGQLKNGRMSNYVNEATIKYMTKYATKVDFKHKYYKQIILTSNGIGANYTNTYNAKLNKYNGEQTQEYYRTREGHKTAIPIYWRNKLYNEEEREKLWLQKLDKQERYVLGTKIDTSNGNEEYFNAIEHAQKINKELGYNEPRWTKGTWNKIEYENQLRQLKINERLK